MLRLRKSFGLVFVLIVGALTLLLLHTHRRHHYLPAELGQDEEGNEILPLSSKSHPIHQLIAKNEADFKELLSRQSKTLDEAVAEYRRRYGLPPPPNFDKWYAFAVKHGVQLIDEYDTIYDSLLPFWAIPPSTIRERTREAIGFDNALIAVLIRNGEVTKMEGGGSMYEWHRDATPLMLKNFIKHLPDMDLAFNIHDEPRIVMSNDDLSRHVTLAKAAQASLLSRKSLTNSFSSRPSDMNAGDRIQEYKTTRFNRFAHQQTWQDSRLSCPPDSAVRNSIDDVLPESSIFSHDSLPPYTHNLPLDFIANHTAYTDICNSPSLAVTHGFFDRPNAFDVSHTLFPIFSQSKVSSFQDILYPSPWYYMHRVLYEPARDLPFHSKNSTLYWRGSTTGGFSRDGGWRRQHRQRFVQRTMPLGQARILARDNTTSEDHWLEQTVDMKDYSHKYFDVAFTYVGQCDPGDCDAQKAYFEILPHVDMFDALGSKYLLDIDGNAFSGRYYAWLASQSLVFKLALFREWHDEWLTPWVHYVPLGLRGEEVLEALRYFEEEEMGRMQALRLAEQGREWAERSLRDGDLEVWYFRLLLEYGRLIDDRRAEIGFTVDHG